MERAANQVHKEQTWLPQIAGALPQTLSLTIPTPVAFGEPGPGYDMHWSVYEWLGGNDAFDEPITDLQHAATALGEFGVALRSLDASSGPPSFRGSPLAEQEVDVLAAIDDASAGGFVDRKQALDAWQVIVSLPQWEHPPVWAHGDLLPGNLLVENGRVSAVIDFGGLGVGDPACDMMVAWTVLTADERDVFRECSQIDDATWQRGRGWAFGFGLMAHHYHQVTNPVLAAVGRRAIEHALPEFVAMA